MKLTHKFTDFTGLGQSKSSFDNYNFITNDMIYKNYGKRFNFYIQLLESLNSSNPNASLEVLKIFNLNKYQDEKIDDKLKFINSYLDKKFVNKEGQDNIKDVTITEVNEEGQDKIKDDIITKLNEAIRDSIYSKKYTVEDSSNLTNKSKDSSIISRRNSIRGGAAFAKFKEGIMEKDISDKIKVDDKGTIEDESKTELNNRAEQILPSYNDNIEYGPKVEAVRISDRLIFIIATYILRAVALFMVEWGVHVNYINTFVKAFSLYFGVYTCIFLVLFVLTNASEKDKIFRMLFFYINTQSEGGKGLIRAIVHILCVMFLFPLPFIVREYREMRDNVLSFTDKRAIVNAVNKFTMLIWLLTSIIALRL